MNISTAVVDDATITVSVTGELDLAVADNLLAVGRAALDSAGTVYLDLAGVTFIDSTAIGVLVSLRNAADRMERDLVLRDPPPRIERILGITGLVNAFEIESNGQRKAAS
jgi:anti-anti-sigma factor